MRSAEIGQQKHIPHPRTNRSASTPVGSVAQHAAASDEAAGAAMGGCCRTGAAARFVFGCPPAAIGLCAVEEATRWSSEPPEEGRACLRRTYHRAADAAGVLDRVRVFDRWQDEDSVERFRCTRLGKPSSCLAGSGTMIHVTAQMRVLVAIEPVDGRKRIDSLVRVCQAQLGEDPFSGCVFFFRIRPGKCMVDGVYWAGVGYLASLAA